MLQELRIFFMKIELFSWLKKKEDIDYGELLEKLDTDIRECQVELSTIAVRQRKQTSKFLFYSVPTYLVSAVIFGLKAYDLITTIYAAGIVLLGPIVIYGIRKLIRNWYERKHRIQMEILKELRETQTLKVEELKKKTSYYMTKGIIERYETPTKVPDQNSMSTPQGIRRRPIDATKTPQSHKPSQEPRPAFRRVSENKESPTPMPKIDYSVQSNTDKSWLDKAIDIIVGEDDGPNQKYALICENCFIHNGLVLPQEYMTAKFKCRSCGYLTIKKSSLQSAASNQKLNLGVVSRSPAVTSKAKNSLLSPESNDEDEKMKSFVGQQSQNEVEKKVGDDQEDSGVKSDAESKAGEDKEDSNEISDATSEVVGDKDNSGEKELPEHANK